VRLPAAIAGTLTVLVLYLAVRRTLDPGLAILSAAVLAVSPWHIRMNRIGFRAVLPPLVVLLVMIAVERGRFSPMWFPVSGLAAGLAMHTYSAASLFVPPVEAAWTWRCRKELRRSPGFALGGTAIATVVTRPVLKMLVSPICTARPTLLLVDSPWLFVTNCASYFSPTFLSSAEAQIRGTVIPESPISTCWRWTHCGPGRRSCFGGPD
jgi:predicted membrane-bound dolichyl-phosphate-mannose-protein mannosyltransferase